MTKEYNITAIVQDNNLKLLFECDKEKNKQCSKRNCNKYCNYTTDSRYIKAKTRQEKKDITDKELICNLESEIEYYKHELDLLNKVHKDDTEYINKQDELIKEYEDKQQKNKTIDKLDTIKTTTSVYINNRLVETMTKYEHR